MYKSLESAKYSRQNALSNNNIASRADTHRCNALPPVKVSGKQPTPGACCTLKLSSELCHKRKTSLGRNKTPRTSSRKLPTTVAAMQCSAGAVVGFRNEKSSSTGGGCARPHRRWCAIQRQRTAIPTSSIGAMLHSFTRHAQNERAAATLHAAAKCAVVLFCRVERERHKLGRAAHSAANPQALPKSAMSGDTKSGVATEVGGALSREGPHRGALGRVG